MRFDILKATSMRRVLCALLCLTLVFSMLFLSACNTEEEPEATEPEQTEEAKTQADNGLPLNENGKVNVVVFTQDAPRGTKVTNKNTQTIELEATNVPKNIVTELNANADEVVSAVDKSMSATEKQNEMINTAADNFEKLDKNITTLIGGIKNIDADISGIFAANNRIVESISQLSATAEEITATAEQAKNLSNNNLQSAEEVKAAIDTIQTTSEGLEKYF